MLLRELLERGSPLQVSKDVERDVRSVRILKGGRAVFNGAGNKCLIVVWINSSCRVLYIRFIGTHRMYDTVDAQTI